VILVRLVAIPDLVEVAAVGSGTDEAVGTGAGASLGNDLALVRRLGTAFSAAAFSSAGFSAPKSFLMGVGGGNLDDLVLLVETGTSAGADDTAGAGAGAAADLTPALRTATLAVFSTGGSATAGGSASAISSAIMTSANNWLAIPL
jgi:hypothetical protein